MRVFAVALAMLISLTGLAFSQAATDQEEVDYIICDYSGLRWDTSPSRISITVIHGEVKSAYHFASLYAMMMFISEAEILGNDVGELGEFKMQDYESFGDEKPAWIIAGGDGPPEMFVVHTETVIPGSQAPYMISFINEQAAIDWAKENDGEVYDAEEAMGVLFGIIGPELEKKMGLDETVVDAPPVGEDK